MTAGTPQAAPAANLELTTVRIPTADLGPESPLVPLTPPREVHQVELEAGVVDAEMAAATTYGHPHSMAPFLPQDGYDRELRDVEHRVAVLSNEHLTATVLLDLGGRLWSLIDRATGRNLLYTNDVLQPANLALRNAWFSGGVEWNIGTIGHHPLTAAPMHARVLHRSDGAAALRLYEYERLREVVYSVDLILHPDARRLLVHVRIQNTTAREVPMYWWSNMAVPQPVGTRTVCPANSAWEFGYEQTMRKRAVPGAPDVTRPDEAHHSADYFFDLSDAPDPEAATVPWISALAADGYGLLQASTPRLRGRKLFVWGDGRGGRTWQSWLSQGTGAYAEIQAGLARTQLEHLRMPPDTTWSWVESYGPVHVPADLVDTTDWQRLVAGTAAAADLSAIENELTTEAKRDTAQDTVGERANTGSGWGALEVRRRSMFGEAELSDATTPFTDDQISEAQRPWLRLLDGDPSPAGEPESYQSSPAWLKPLQESADPASLIHLAVIAAAQGQPQEAMLRFRQRLEHGPSWQAERGVAALSALQGDTDAAVEHYERACRLRPHDLRLFVEAATTLLDLGAAATVSRLHAALDKDLAGNGRVRLLQARAALADADGDTARRLLAEGIQLDDVAEGDESLGDLWRAAHADLVLRDRPDLSPAQADRVAADKYPLPARYDFRMKPDATLSH